MERRCPLPRRAGRLDSFPSGDIGDIGVTRGLSRLRGLPADRRLIHDEYVNRFGDIRGYLYYFNLDPERGYCALCRIAPPKPKLHKLLVPRPHTPAKFIAAPLFCTAQDRAIADWRSGTNEGIAWPRA